MSRARSSFLAGCRDLLPLMPAGVAFGLVVGAAIAQAGLGAAESLGMSGFVYGASAQLAATVLWRDGAPLFVVVATALVINARFFIYSASLAPVLGPSRWWHALLYGYFLRDGIYAATTTRAVPDPAIDPLPYFLGGALVDWGVWIVSTAAGTLGASRLPASWSLDFIVPLVFIALLAGAAKTRVAWESAGVGALAAVLFVPMLPLQAGTLVAILAGMAWGWWRDRGTPVPSGVEPEVEAA